MPKRIEAIALRLLMIFILREIQSVANLNSPTKIGQFFKILPNEQPFANRQIWQMPSSKSLMIFF